MRFFSFTPTIFDMGIFDFIHQKLTGPRKQPEDFYVTKVTGKFVSVEHPKFGKYQIDWDEVEEIKIITTDEGPILPDVWIGLFGKGNKCLIPQGAKGYDKVYNIVSKYEGFSFENVIGA